MSALKFVRSVWESSRVTSGFHARLFPKLQILAASPGVVTLVLDIEDEHTNRQGILHGGTIASLVDVGGSLAIASHGLFATGVSTDMNISYIAPGGRVGDKIRAEVRCDKLGRRFAFTSAQFANAQGRIVARGSHTKFVDTAWADEDGKNKPSLYPASA